MPFVQGVFSLRTSVLGTYHQHYAAKAYTHSPMQSHPRCRTKDQRNGRTITTTVLASAIYAEGVKNVAAGRNPMHLPRGSQATVDRALSFLSANTKTINTTAEIAQVATISTKGDVHVRNLNVQATEKVSREGVITVKEGCSIDARSRSPKGCGSIAGSSARLS